MRPDRGRAAHGLHRLCRAGLLGVLLALVGCGGGGGGGSPAAPSSSGGTGGAGSGSGGTTSSAPSTPIVVDGGPAGAFNVPFISVTVCTPGTSTCQIIDHVILDTGSTGLRLVASALNSTLALPAETDGSGNPLRECYAYVTSYVWGSMVKADVSIAGQKQAGLPVQLIGDTAAGAPAAQCTAVANSDFAAFINQPTATSTLTDTVASFGANGILGVSPSGAQDCGSACIPGTTEPAAFLANYYYSCPTAGTCAPTTMTLANQATNLVAVVNGGQVNGLAISLPAVAAAGVASTSGTLTLGVSTTASDTPPATTAFYGLDSYALFSTQLNATSYESVVDSGTAYFLFTDASIASCPVDGVFEFFCPATTLSLSATLGENSEVVHARGTSGSHDFAIQTYANLANTSFAAPDIGSPCGLYLSGTCYPATAESMPFFIWGLPFYFGHTVYFVYPGATAGSVQGPAVGFD